MAETIKINPFDLVSFFGNFILSTGRLFREMTREEDENLRRTIDLIFKRADICVETKERPSNKVIKLYPKFVRETQSGLNRVFAYRLPPGLSFEKIGMSIRIIESYLKSEILEKALENDPTAHFSFTILSGHLLDYIEYSNEEEHINNDGLWIPIGWSRRGLEQVNLGNDSSCHLMIGGASGAGKSTLAKFFLVMMHMKYSESEVRLWLADLKHGADVAMLGDNPKLVDRKINEPEDLESLIDELSIEVKRRYEIFKKAKCGASISLYNEKFKNKKMNRIILFVDEYTKLEGKDFEIVREKMTKLTGESRGAGVHVIISCHRPNFELISGTMKNNMAVVVAFKCNSVSAQVLLGKDEAHAAKAINKDIKGRAILSYADNVLVQIPYITNKKCEEIMEFYQKEINHNGNIVDITPIQTTK